MGRRARARRAAAGRRRARGPPPPRLAGLRLVADVKTVNPICDSHLSESSRSALSAAIVGENGKVHKYGHLVNQQGAEFIGLGFETTGAMSPGALLLVKRLSTRADERGYQTLDADLCTWTARRWSTRSKSSRSLGSSRSAAPASVSDSILSAVIAAAPRASLPTADAAEATLR